MEKRVLTGLVNDHGFAVKWQRRQDGIYAKGKLYTPDVELSVAYGNGTKSIRALVEIKPSRHAFTDDIAARMRIVARHYQTDDFIYMSIKIRHGFRFRWTPRLVPS